MQRHAHRLAIFAIASVVVTVIAAIIGGAAASAQTTDVWDRVENRYADNDGVRVHYVTLGEGPLVVLIHGSPDFWYLWRDYLASLSVDHQVVAIDQRGYNLSDKPKGVENYSFNS